MNELAKLPVNHSWAKPLMELEEPQASEAEENLNQWIREITHKEYPELPKEYNPVERVLRHSLLNLLEIEAIEAYREKNAENWELFPDIQDVSDAVLITNADMNYTMTSEEMDKAADLLIKILEGEIKPEVSSLMPKSQTS